MDAMQVIANLAGWALDALIVVGVLAALVVALVLAVRRAPLSPAPGSRWA